MVESDLHIAGSPCVDYSPRGARGAENGHAYSCFLIWVAKRILLQEAIIIHENVREFQPGTLLAFLGQLYHVESTLLNPQNQGWPIARCRRYTILRHRYKTRCFRSPWKL